MSAIAAVTRTRLMMMMMMMMVRLTELECGGWWLVPGP